MFAFTAIPLSCFSARCSHLKRSSDRPPSSAAQSHAAAILAFVFLFVVGAVVAHAQDSNAGVLPFSTHVGGQYDSIDLASDNILVTIPVLAKTGKIPFSYNLVANSRAYLFCLDSCAWRVSAPGYGGTLTGVPSAPLGAFLGQTTTYSLCNGSGSEITESNFTVGDMTGAIHPFSTVQVQYGPCGVSGGGTATTIDGSGYTLTIVAANPPTYTMYDRMGNNLTGSGGLVDPDGTQMSLTGTLTGTGNNVKRLWTYTDTLGQVTLTSTVAAFRYTGGYSGPDLYTYNDANGNPQTVQVNYTLYSVNTNFGCSGIPEFNGAISYYFPTSVVFPDGEMLGISYEPTPGLSGSITGRFSKLTLPAGGFVSYEYSGGNNGISCSTGLVPILTRTINDGKGHNSVWTYTSSPMDAHSNFTVTAADPAGNTITHHFHGEFQTEEVVQDAHLGLLRTTVTCYNGANSSQSACIAPQSYGFPEPVYQTDVYTSLGTSAPSLVETKYDYSGLFSYGNVVAVKTYNFGATYPPTGTPIAETDVTYANLAGVSCGTASSHIYVLPCTSTTYSSGSMVGQTKFTYNTGGHPTQVSTWVGGTTYLTTYAAFNSNGTTASTTDVNGAQTTYSYSGPGGCNGLLLTSTSYPIVNGIQMSSSQRWDCNLGAVTSATDVNGQTVMVSYAGDPLRRVTSTTDQVGNVTLFTYTPTTSERVMTFNNNASTVDVLTTLDGLGRLFLKQTRQAPGSSSFDTVGYVYDSNGRLSGTGLPCVSTAGVPCSSAATTTTFDALGRPLQVTDGGGGTLSYTYSANDVLQVFGPAPAGENTKSQQMEYDVLGRLSSVCEITAATGSGTCGQTSTKTGYWTKYAYGTNSMTVTQNAQGAPQSRSYYYDGLTRLTSETNPESGTTTYTYDSDSTCSTYKGDQVKRVDAMGNITCYAYDALHRNTGITYPSGPYAASTSPKTFVYDASSLFSCTTGANLKGRLAEAYTGTSASKITDLGYCYTPRGEISDVYESTPHSGGYYHVPMTYWANGLLNLAGPFLAERPAGYLPDGEGRAGKVYYIYGGGYQGISVPSITYNAASQPTQLMTSCSGSTCYPITYAYDPNTLRMTQYSAALNGGTVSGTMTWNPNGSLKTLAIADPLNAADTQTCNYAADDLSRLASVNCGSVWAQTFSYDPFGNISKSGSINWLPGYNSSTNRYTLAGTSYDADGNVTNDTFAAYSWDADGKNLSASHQFGPWAGQTWSFIDDAFGHRVEFSINGTYEYSYLTLGKYRLSAIGQNAAYSEFPLPGGSVLSQNGGANGVQLADWLGTIRAFYSSTGGGYSQSGAHAPFGESYSYNQGYPSGFAGQGGLGWGQGGDGAMANTTYWFPERDLRSSQGRWLTPDPAGMGAVNPSNPQTWNRYAYALNNPLSYTDPLGLQCKYGAGFTLPDASDWNTVGYGCTGDPAGTADSYFNSAIDQSHAQDLAVYLASIPWYKLQGGHLMLTGYAFFTGRTPYCTGDCLGTMLPYSFDLGSSSDEEYVPGGETYRVRGFAQVTFSVYFVSLSLIEDDFHNQFFSIGGNLGKGIPIGFSVARGWFNGKYNASSNTSCNTLSGLSFNAAAGLVVGGAESYTPSNGQWSTQLGIFTPQLGVGASYTWAYKGCGGS
jgi:RHS repeat-associated protein